MNQSTAAELDLYQDVVMDHKRAPRHFGTLPAPTHQAGGQKPMLFLDDVHARSIQGPATMDGIGPTRGWETFWLVVDVKRRRSAPWAWATSPPPQIWPRGNDCWPTSSTSNEASASRCAQAPPAGPAPMTITSQEAGTEGSGIGPRL